MAKELPQENEQLIERLRQPESCRTAFNEVVRIYSEPLYWQIRRMVENHDDASDILQNTFMKAWQSIENFRGDARLSTWLYRIASLPEKQRMVFNMKYFDDMKYERMSEILGTSVGALKASYHLAVKKIEKYFDGKE